MNVTNVTTKHLQDNLWKLILMQYMNKKRTMNVINVNSKQLINDTLEHILVYMKGKGLDVMNAVKISLQKVRLENTNKLPTSI